MKQFLTHAMCPAAFINSSQELMSVVVHPNTGVASIEVGM